MVCQFFYQGVGLGRRSGGVWGGGENEFSGEEVGIGGGFSYLFLRCFFGLGGGFPGS